MVGKTNSAFGSGGDEVRMAVLNVVGGTSRPVNPSENTIWVNTGTAITSWQISFDEPNSPSAGDVWLEMRYDSGMVFDLATIPEVMIGIGSVYQYGDGQWNMMPFEIYADGETLASTLLLYFYGRYNSAYEWTLFRNARVVPYGTFANESDYFQITSQGTGGGAGGTIIYYTPVIDVTDKSSVIFELYHPAANQCYDRWWISVYQGDCNFANAYTNAEVRDTWLSNTGKSRDYYELDVSGLSGEYHISVGNNIGADTVGGGYTRVYSVEVV